MILSLIKKSFKQVIENSSITLFLVTYLIVISILAPLARTNFLVISLGICAVLLTIAYVSGWFYMINTISSTKDEELKSKNMFSVFFEGIGKNFLPVFIALIFYFLATAVMFFLSGFLANHFFGDINVILKDIMAKATENTNLIELLSTLPTDKQYTLYGWQFCFIAGSSIFSFLFMMYFPFLINSNENVFLRPFTSFYKSLKFIFDNFLLTLGLYSIIYFSYVFLNILRTFTANFTIVSLILFFVYIYFLATIVMLIFNYYEAKNNSTDGPDCIGKDETSDSIGENN